jgi:hypothetical protein
MDHAVHVSVSMEGPSGATSLVFHPRGGVVDMKMEIQGPLDVLLDSVLPHEITHAIFAHHFQRTVPRWADEGGSVLSEDGQQRERQDNILRGILKRAGQYQLRQLFAIADYPGRNDRVMCLYAQGFSVSHYLVQISDRKTFLRFVGIGMCGNWDQAVQTCYGLHSVEKLEDAWLNYLRDTKGISIGQPPMNKDDGQLPAKSPSAKSGIFDRLTARPVDLFQPAAVIRGVMPVLEPQTKRRS